MNAVLPGRPQSTLHAFDTASWAGYRLVAYVSYNALIVLRGPQELLQTISHADGELLNAVAIDSASGKIAVSTDDSVFVYRCVSQGAGALRWSLQHLVKPVVTDPRIRSLYWGLPEELLIGGSRLTLVSTDDAEVHELWSTKLANNIKVAAFSHDASLIASCGDYDRMVKLWRRLFFGGDDERFEATYLPHPSTVTGLRWRGRPTQEQHADCLLYTLCADSRVRIWSGSDLHCVQILYLWGELDILQALQPRSPVPDDREQRRYAFILDSWELKDLLERALERPAITERELHTRMHLKEVASQDAEALLITDNGGFMSAWALERACDKVILPHQIINIAHIDGFDMALEEPASSLSDYVQCRCFAGDNGYLQILVHSFDGTLRWLSCHIDQLFDPSPQSGRLTIDAALTGTSHPITYLKRATNEIFISCTESHEVVIWGYDESHISRLSIIIATKPVHDAFLVSSDHLLLLHENSASLWRINSQLAQIICDLQLEINADSKSSITLLRREFSRRDPQPNASLLLFHETGESQILDVKNGTIASANIHTTSPQADYKFCKLLPACSRQATDHETLRYLAATGSTDRLCLSDARLHTPSRTLDVQNKRMVSGISIATSMYEASTSGMLAVSSTESIGFAIFDLSNSQKEYEEAYSSHETIQGFHWSNTNVGNPLLAVRTDYRIRVYASAQLPTSGVLSKWVILCTIESRQHSMLPISSVMWLTARQLVYTTGNQIFVCDCCTALTDAARDASEMKDLVGLPVDRVCDLLDAILPLYHPDHLSLLCASGKEQLAAAILGLLESKLRFMTEVDVLDSLLEQRSGVQDLFDSLLINETIDSNDSRSSAERAADINGYLDRLPVTHVQDTAKPYMKVMVDAILSVKSQSQALDPCGSRYLFSLQTKVRDAGSAGSDMNWRDFTWASLSSSQDILADAAFKQYDGKMIWSQARQTGLFVWLEDLDALRQRLEVIARNEYTKSEERNPVDCSLLYLALRKKSVLQGLWRMAGWNKEQRATMRLLANDFDDPRWKTAALKNAYALLGRRRTEYAAAFFLLAGNLRDAVNVIATEMSDLQLAIAVARAYEGDDGPILREILQDRVLPLAVATDNSWMAVWSLTILKRHDDALRATVLPLQEVIQGVPEPTEFPVRLFDPTLSGLFTTLRQRWFSQRQSRPFPVSIALETEFVLKCARQYRRMGADLIALDLVRNWQFTRHETVISKTITATADVSQNQPKSLLDDWAPQEQKKVTADFTDATLMVDGVPRKKVTEEPSTNSILDSFGF